MMGRIWTAYRVELSKAARNRFTYSMPVLLVLGVCLVPLIEPISRDGTSDYGFIACATRIGINILGLMMVLGWSASSVSSELGSGTIRMTLVRPLRRHEFAAAKLLFSFTFAAAVMVVAGVSSWVAAAVFGDVAGVTYGGEAIHSNLAMLGAYLAGMMLAFFPLSAAAAYGVMVSTLTRSTGAAVGATVGIWLAVDMVKYPLRVAPFLFSTWLEAPWDVFAGRADGLNTAWLPDAAVVVVVSVAWTALFAVVAGLAMSRRNLHA